MFRLYVLSEDSTLTPDNVSVEALQGIKTAYFLETETYDELASVIIPKFDNNEFLFNQMFIVDTEKNEIIC